MEATETIRRCLMYFLVIMILLISLTESTSALSANPSQVSEMCMFENVDFSEDLCNPGSVRHTNLYGCGPIKRCCACPDGLFMDKYNNCTECKTLRNCTAERKEVLFEGNFTHDAVCGDDIFPTTHGPITTFSPSPTVGTTSQSRETKDKHLNCTTQTTPGDEDGNPVLRFDLLSVISCTLFILACLVIVIFICYPGIPKKLNRMLHPIRFRSNRTNGIKNEVVLISYQDTGGGESSAV